MSASPLNPVHSSPIDMGGGGGWKRSLAESIRNTADLWAALGLPPELRPPGQPDFPVLVPRSYLQRMERGNPADPLLLQVVPGLAEQVDVPGFHRDPVDDHAARIAPGLLHKYHGRALLITTGACAVHCRYCFRRHYPYSQEPHSLTQWTPALEAIRDDTTLSEVILSGGDPLVLPDEPLQRLCECLAEIPHLQRLRIHTRLPIVLPDRITPHLLEILTGTRLTPVVVVHANHARELEGDCAVALDQLRRAGVMLLNQAVLLRKINDSVAALLELSERCASLGVVPYYLHQLDRVQGAAHFEVPVEQGRKLIEELRSLLPGYLVPRYVAEIPGDSSKRPLMS